MTEQSSIDKKDLKLAKKLIKESEKKKEKLIPVTNIDPISLAPWSVSKYKTLYRCPFSFYLRYVLKLTVPESHADLTSDSVRTDIGKLGHEILEEVIIHDISFENALEKTATEEVRSTITEEYWPLVEDLRVPVREFISRMQSLKRKYPVKEFRVEGQLAVDKDWKPTTFGADDAYFRAMLDLNIVMENGDAILLDHKLGGDPSWGLRNYMLQLEAYGALSVHSYDDLKSITPGIHFIQAMEIKTEKKLSKDYLTNRVRNRMDMHFYNAVEHVHEVGRFDAIKGTLCKYCDYRDLCVKYRKPRDKKSTAGLLQPIMESSGDFLK